jgi:hypothetical protein
VGIHGKQWGVISSLMEDRSAAQISARWEKCLDPKLTKGPFTPEEDQTIIDYVERNGPQNWPALCAILVSRSPKQCRERWLNHLSPGISSVPWTKEEDIAILQNYSKIGARWSLIAQFLPGRTDNSIKNRWNSSISKRIQTDARGVRILGPDYAKKPKPVGKPPLIRTDRAGTLILDGNADQAGQGHAPLIAMGSPSNEFALASPFAPDFGPVSPLDPLLSPSLQGIFGSAFASGLRGGFRKDSSDSGEEREPGVRRRG